MSATRTTVVRVKRPLILLGPTVILPPLAPRPFMAGNTEDVLPAYAVPPPRITRGPPPLPVNPPRRMLGMPPEDVPSWQSLPEAWTKDRPAFVLKGPPPTQAIVPRPVLSAGPLPSDAWAIVDHEGGDKKSIHKPPKPPTPPPVGAPMPFLRVVVVNPSPDQPIQPVVQRPVIMQPTIPTGVYRPPVQTWRNVDDETHAQRITSPILLRRTVPTPAPVGAPRARIYAPPLEETALYIPVRPWFTRILPKTPFRPCPPAPGRGDELCSPDARVEVISVSSVNAWGQSWSSAWNSDWGASQSSDECPSPGIADQSCTTSARADECC